MGGPGGPARQGLFALLRMQASIKEPGQVSDACIRQAVYPSARNMERSSDGVTTGISDPLKSLPFQVTR